VLVRCSVVRATGSGGVAPAAEPWALGGQPALGKVIVPVMLERWVEHLSGEHEAPERENRGRNTNEVPPCSSSQVPCVFSRRPVRSILPNA
jgi:hypothetical protein